MASDHLATGTPRRPATAVLGGLFTALACAAWLALAITCLVRAGTDAGYGVIFAVGALATVTFAVTRPADRVLARAFRWLSSGRTDAGRRLAIAILIAPMVVLAFVVGIDPGRLLAGILWIVLSLPCLLFAFLAGSAITARGRASLKSERMVMGPGIFAAVISGLFLLGVVFGDDPWGNWMIAGPVLGVVGILADGFWATASARAYVDQHVQATE